MQSMTVEQLRAMVGAGSMTGVTLKGQSGGFFVEIATRSGQDAMREAHEAAAYSQWLSAEIQEAIDDPRSSISHDEVMARMDACIARHMVADK